jgi:hypothetical protein
MGKAPDVGIGTLPGHVLMRGGDVRGESAEGYIL